MNSDSIINNDAMPKPRGWDALEIKLKAKGLSQGEIAQARKSFDDGIEILAKMFLAKKAQEGFE